MKKIMTEQTLRSLRGLFFCLIVLSIIKELQMGAKWCIVKGVVMLRDWPPRAVQIRRQVQMQKETVGTVVQVAQQGWLKFNTKPVRAHSLDGSIFPHVIKVKYEVAGHEYTCKQWLDAGSRVPDEGDKVRVAYKEEKPGRGRVV